MTSDSLRLFERAKLIKLIKLDNLGSGEEGKKAKKITLCGSEKGSKQTKKQLKEPRLFGRDKTTDGPARREEAEMLMPLSGFSTLSGEFPSVWSAANKSAMTTCPGAGGRSHKLTTPTHTHTHT